MATSCVQPVALSILHIVRVKSVSDYFAEPVSVLLLPNDALTQLLQPVFAARPLQLLFSDEQRLLPLCVGIL